MRRSTRPLVVGWLLVLGGWHQHAAGNQPAAGALFFFTVVMVGSAGLRRLAEEP